MSTDGSVGSNCTDFNIINIANSPHFPGILSMTAHNVDPGDKVRGRIRTRACKGSRDSYSVANPYYCSVWHYANVSFDRDP